MTPCSSVSQHLSWPNWVSVLGPAPHGTLHGPAPHGTLHAPHGTCAAWHLHRMAPACTAWHPACAWPRGRSTCALRMQQRAHWLSLPLSLSLMCASAHRFHGLCWKASGLCLAGSFCTCLQFMAFCVNYALAHRSRHAHVGLRMCTPQQLVTCVRGLLGFPHSRTPHSTSLACDVRARPPWISSLTHSIVQA